LVIVAAVCAGALQWQLKMPVREFPQSARRQAVPVLRGWAAIALITAVCYRLHANTAFTGFAYLTAVMLNCLDSGLGSAALVSLAAVLCLDYFFTQPLFSLSVSDPLDGAALAAFGTASLITTQLASRARRARRAAENSRRSLERLYSLAQRILGLHPFAGGVAELAAAVRSSLEIGAVCIFDARSAASHAAGFSVPSLEERTRDAYISGCDRDDAAARLAVRVLRASGRAIGAIGFAGLEDPGQTAGPAAALVLAALDRSQAAQTAAAADAEARNEILRSAILDALAHEFKTPLAAILAAAGGLRAAAPLTAPQEELAAIVESEAERLSGLTTRVLRLARLDGEELRPRLESVDVSELISETVERQSAHAFERQISVHLERAPAEVAADSELLQLALAQLLDNACRYSPAGSEIEVRSECQGGRIGITVWNSGEEIAPAERERIFERMYRGSLGQRMSAGTGLGLYVARKIALAHGGNLELVAAPARRDGVAFRLILPLAKGASESVAPEPIEAPAQSADRR
jgi:two-component system sensor histidine kinase KdpD